MARAVVAYSRRVTPAAQMHADWLMSGLTSISDTDLDRAEHTLLPFLGIVQSIAPSPDEDE